MISRFQENFIYISADPRRKEVGMCGIEKIPILVIPV